MSVKRRLRVLGASLEIEAEYTRDAEDPPGIAAPLFRAARAISEVVSREALRREREAGRAPTCSEGCAACCQQLVPISTVEAVLIAARVAAMPKPERVAVEKRFVEAIRRLEKAGLLDVRAPKGRSSMTAPRFDDESPWDTASRRYRELGVVCPLLHQRRCSIYDSRPLICREYVVTSPPDACRDLRSRGVVAVPRPVRMSEALTDAANALTLEELSAIPLVLALEWAEHHGSSLDADVPAARAEEVLLDAIEVEE